MTQTLKTLAIVAAVSTLAACGSLGKFNSNGDEQIRQQKLQTTFDNGLKIETNCSWFSDECKFVSMEARYTMPALGGTDADGNSAQEKAELHAKAMIAKYLDEKIESSSFTTTMSKHVQKAKDRLKTNNGGMENEVVTMTEDEAKTKTTKTGNDNISYRENANNIAYELTKTVKSLSATKLVGCTVTWLPPSGQNVTAVVFCSEKNRKQAINIRSLYNGK